MITTNIYPARRDGSGVKFRLSSDRQEIVDATAQINGAGRGNSNGYAFVNVGTVYIPDTQPDLAEALGDISSALTSIGSALTSIGANMRGSNTMPPGGLSSTVSDINNVASDLGELITRLR